MMPAVDTDTAGEREGASVVSRGFLWQQSPFAGNDNRYYIIHHYYIDQ